MNLTKQLLWSTLAAVTANGLLSCSDNDSPAEAPSFSYEVIANAQTAYGDTAKVAAGKTTLALTESAGQLLSGFNTGEKIIGFNVSSDGAGTTATAYSQLSAASTGWNSDFTGQVTGTRAPKTTDDFAFFYPGSATQSGTVQSVVPVEKVTKVVDGKTYILYQQKTQIKPIVELNLSAQDGTLATISKKFDYQWAKAKPTSVSGNTVNISVGKLQRKIAVWGLRFTNPSNAAFTNIDSINISEVKGSEALHLGTGNFVTDNNIDEIWGISATPKTGTKFTSAGGKYTYIALLPGNYKDVIVTVYAGGKVYQREYPTLNISADHFYKTDILKMQEATPKAYVEINGVKWATGNFIRYNQGGQEYWGIAPRQWWIAHRTVEKNGVITTEQFINNPSGDENDKDLFRFGDIANAHKVYGNQQYNTAGEIRQKFYTGGTQTVPTPNRSQATHGDLVWYHTMNYKDQYRYPSHSELAGLFNNASVIPGYCYSERGLKIYGAYFYQTPIGQARVQGFPTGSKEVEKFKNVSNLVRANKGLFLPIAGFVGALATHIHYKELTDPNAVGKYLCDLHIGGATPSVSYEFGTISYKRIETPASQARAIRPVWVGTNPISAAQNPTHPDFKYLN